MKLLIKDGNSVSQYMVAKGIESPLNHSGVVAVTGNSEIALPANANRSGYLIQNLSSNDLRINDMGSALDVNSFILQPKNFWPPTDYPVTTNEVTISGVSGDLFLIREW